ncbi:Uu.00g017110.m01.CDS01 [Anthostomella pinea]|uniref:Uu.00g017110.m01.CDS01 n=1 Tax=Anthostomella pinea TaxID=933095 RepID=A0AAI8YNC4_9PEZI|nr:Uu.00g017110.m01.CDS01 [Anthostomella pinea]
MISYVAEIARKYLWPGLAPTACRPGTVRTAIQFFKPLAIHVHEKPYICECDVRHVEGAKKTNVEFEKRGVDVHDVRGNEARFTLERNGFEIVQHQSALSRNDFRARETVEEKYLPECEEMVRRYYGAERVIVINWIVRHDHRGTPRKYKGTYMPVTAAHVDQTQKALLSRLVQQVGKEEAENISSTRRYLIVNVWRPLSDPVMNYPLGFCDLQTVKPEDCTPVDLVKTDSYEGENLYLRYSPQHRFYYLSKQRPHEVLLLRMAESDPEHPGRVYQGVPHAAFPLPPCRPGDTAPPARESIEVRILVVV